MTYDEYQRKVFGFIGVLLIVTLAFAITLFIEGRIEETTVASEPTAAQVNTQEGCIIILLDAFHKTVHWWDVPASVCEGDETVTAKWSDSSSPWRYCNFIAKGVNDTLIVDDYETAGEREQVITEFELHNVPFSIRNK